MNRAKDITLGIEEVRIKGGELLLSYRLRNGASSAIFVYNQLPDRFAQKGRKPAQTPRSDLGQMCFVAPRCAIVLLGPAPVPFHGFEVSYIGFPAPFASKVKPGAALSATIRAELPLVEWSDRVAPRRTGEGVAPEPIDTLRVIAIYAFEEDVRHVTRNPLFWGSYEVDAIGDHRVETEVSVEALKLSILTHPQMIRFT